jgi:hypothetical protein
MPLRKPKRARRGPDEKTAAIRARMTAAVSAFPCGTRGNRVGMDNPLKADWDRQGSVA